MLSQVRQKKLLEHVDNLTVVTVKQLVELLDSSPATIRRDITELDSQGKLKKIRNGAEKMLSPGQATASHMADLYPHISDYGDFAESERIAEQAVALCQNKDSIYVGAGQNAFLMSKYLLGSNIRVYSNYIPFISYLITESFPHLVVLGGQYINNQGMLVSPASSMSFQGRFLFVDGDGLSDAGLTKSALLAYMEEKRMLEHLDKVVALVNSDKVGVYSGIPVFGLDEIDIVITGKNADPAMIQLLRDKHVEVVLV